MTYISFKTVIFQMGFLLLLKGLFASPTTCSSVFSPRVWLLICPAQTRSSHAICIGLLLSPNSLIIAPLQDHTLLGQSHSPTDFFRFSSQDHSLHRSFTFNITDLFSLIPASFSSLIFSPIVLSLCTAPLLSDF